MAAVSTTTTTQQPAQKKPFNVLGHELIDRENLDGAKAITFFMLHHPITEQCTPIMWEWYSKRSGVKLGLFFVRPTGNDRYTTIYEQYVNSGEGEQFHLIPKELQPILQKGDVPAFRFSTDACVPFDTTYGRVGWQSYPSEETKAGMEVLLQNRGTRAYSIRVTVVPSTCTEQKEVSSKFVSDMASLVNNKSFSDVTLLAGESRRPIYAHKCVLSSRLEHFSRQFSSTWNSTNEVSLPNLDYDTVLELLQFLYTGIIPQSTNKILLLQAADYLCCTPVRDSVVARIQTEVTVPEIFQCVIMANYFGSQELIETCFSIMNEHYDECIEHPDFWAIDKEVTKQFLHYSHSHSRAHKTSQNTH